MRSIFPTPIDGNLSTFPTVSVWSMEPSHRKSETCATQMLTLPLSLTLTLARSSRSKITSSRREHQSSR